MMRSESLKRLISTIVKIAFSIGLVFFFSRSLDLDGAFQKQPPSALAVALLPCLLLLLMQTAVSARRLSLVLLADGLNVSYFKVWLYCQYGGFSSHTPASFVGGDFVKAKYILKHGGSLSSVIEILLRDRLVGFTSLVTLVSVVTATSFLVGAHVEYVVPMIVLSVSCLCAIALAFLIPSFQFVSVSRQGIVEKIFKILFFTRKFRQDPRLLGSMFVLSLLIHLLSVLGFLSILYLLGQNFDQSSLFSISSAFLVALLASMVPISVAGWGVREGVLLIFLDKVVADPSLIFVSAVLFGLASFLALCFWLLPYLASLLKKWLRFLSSSRA